MQRMNPKSTHHIRLVLETIIIFYSPETNLIETFKSTKKDKPMPETFYINSPLCIAFKLSENSEIILLLSLSLLFANNTGRFGYR
jgi:hypothetical protein